MLATKLSLCEWRNVTRWKEMRCTNLYDEYSDNEYTESDFDNFVEILFREFAESIKVSYYMVKDILYGHNIEFFQEKTRCFMEYDTITPNDDVFDEITGKLLLPVAYNPECQSSVQMFFDSFEGLELKDKVEILDRLSSAKIQLGVNNVGPGNCFGKTIADLSETAKYQLMKNVFEAEVFIDVELK